MVCFCQPFIYNSLRLAAATIQGRRETVNGQEPYTPRDKVFSVTWKDKRPGVSPWCTSFGGVPNASGLFVPFVEPLQAFDPTTVCSVINDYFLKCLGSSAEGIVEMMEQIKTAWGILQKTQTGAMLSHLCWCIRVALKAQSRVLPIFDNAIYRGALLSGGGFTLRVELTTYRPIEYSTLSTDLKAANTHNVAIAKIASLTGNEVDRNSVEGAKSISELRTALIKAWTKESTAKPEVMKVAPLLNYGDKSWSINTTSILNALDII